MQSPFTARQQITNRAPLTGPPDSDRTVSGRNRTGFVSLRRQVSSGRDRKQVPRSGRQLVTGGSWAPILCRPSAIRIPKRTACRRQDLTGLAGVQAKNKEPKTKPELTLKVMAETRVSQHVPRECRVPSKPLSVKPRDHGTEARLRVVITGG